MRFEAALGVAAAAVLLATVGLAAVVPGFVSPSPSDGEPPARFDVAEMTLSVGAVTGETATLETTAFVRHRGGTADNVSVVARATDSQSGLVVDRDRRGLGTVDDDGEREVPLAVAVPREGGYAVTTLLYVDGRRVDTARVGVDGVGALRPSYADSSAAFYEFDRRPSVEYSVETVENGRATLNVSSYVTNGGDDPESELRLVVTVRQTDSNVVADRTSTRIGNVAPGRTVVEDTRVTVPDGFNYYLDATLRRDGVIIDSARAAANLDPEQTLAVDERREEVEFEASEFETDGGTSQRPTETPEATGDGAGFGAAVAVVALAAGLLAARRWSR